MLAEKTKQLLTEIGEIMANPEQAAKMPRNTFFMKNGDVLCCRRLNGESRFPYANGEYILWAHSTGQIQVKSGLFNVFKPVFDNLEPTMDFFAGVETANGKYFPISITGAAKQLYEPFEVNRYLVYTLAAAYYIADTDFATFVVRASIARKNELRFSCGIINKKKEPLNVRFTSYFEPFLNERDFNDVWEYQRMHGVYHGGGTFEFSRIDKEAVLVIKRAVSGAALENEEHTTYRSAFLGEIRRSVNSAECLKTGSFPKDILSETGDIASEILTFSVADFARVDYVLPIMIDGNNVEKALMTEIDAEAIDEETESFDNTERAKFNNLSICFNGLAADNLADSVLNGFIKKVQKQVDNCAMARYYVGNRLGVRDVYQQLEQAILWDSAQAKEKMLEYLGWIDPSGRPPRQIAIPEKPEQEEYNDRMDLRMHIDQGIWMISCFYSYLTWTGDYSILDEELGYYEVVDKNADPDAEYLAAVRRSDKRDSALEHLVKIAEYLEDKIDTEDGTGCLRTLFGDWNDSIDGVGRTDDPGRKFGTGVSIMASLQFYQNLYEIMEMLKLREGNEERIARFGKARAELGKAIIKHGIEKNDKGETKILFGWGDHMKHKFGSFSDSDGEARTVSAPYAFWVSSGLIEETPELKKVILEAIHSLESRFGLKTLMPAFTPKTTGIGRIAYMPGGTDENACVYSHGAMFCINALFGLGDSEYAWEQFTKLLPVCNPQATRSPFVMANSYRDNPGLGFNGQSPIDWFTGSGTMCIKNIVRMVLGINPNMEGVTLQTANKMPCMGAAAELCIKGNKVKFEYKNENSGSRRIYFNDMLLKTEFDELMQTEKAFIPNEALHDGMTVRVID